MSNQSEAKVYMSIRYAILTGCPFLWVCHGYGRVAEGGPEQNLA